MAVNFPSVDLEWATAGLDLASSGKDYSTLVIAEHYGVKNGVKRQHVFSGEVAEGYEVHDVVNGIVRWPRGTEPGDVLADVADMLDEPEFACCTLRYDASGMGQGVSTLVRDLHAAGRFPGGRPRGLTITGGEQSHTSRTVTKLDLVTTLSRSLHEQRLHVLDCDLAETWRREMHGFQQKVTKSGTKIFEAQSESVHDDLVIATALALTNSRIAQPRFRPLPDLHWLYAEVLGMEGVPDSVRARRRLVREIAAQQA